MDNGVNFSSFFLNFHLPSVTTVNRAAKFESQFIANCSNLLYGN